MHAFSALASPCYVTSASEKISDWLADHKVRVANRGCYTLDFAAIKRRLCHGSGGALDFYCYAVDANGGGRCTPEWFAQDVTTDPDETAAFADFAARFRAAAPDLYETIYAPRGKWEALSDEIRRECEAVIFSLTA
jgi:hypothetical protein